MLKENRINRNANDPATNKTQVRFKWKEDSVERSCCSRWDVCWTSCVMIFIARPHTHTHPPKKTMKQTRAKNEQMIVSVYNLFQPIFIVAAIIRSCNCGAICGREIFIHNIICSMHYYYYYYFLFHNFTYIASFWKISLCNCARFFVFDADVELKLVVTIAIDKNDNDGKKL